MEKDLTAVMDKDYRFVGQMMFPRAKRIMVWCTYGGEMQKPHWKICYLDLAGRVLSEDIVENSQIVGSGDYSLNQRVLVLKALAPADSKKEKQSYALVFVDGDFKGRLYPGEGKKPSFHLHVNTDGTFVTDTENKVDYPIP